MTFLILGIALSAGFAAYVYLGRERLGATGVGFTVLRAAGVGLLVFLFVNPPWPGQSPAVHPTVLLDRSLSMGVTGGQWAVALDSARAIAGMKGRILGFGTEIGPLEDSVPRDADSRLGEALVAARALGGAIHVVTDGELADAALLDSAALAGVSVTVVPRDTAPGAAVVHASVPTTIRRGDTVDVTIGIATWGAMTAESSLVNVSIDGRRIAARSVALPPAPASVMRTLRVPMAAVPAGDRVVEIRLDTEGDTDPRDNIRVRVARITVDPPIALIADPAGWDARYVFETLVAVGGVPVQGFARIADDRWVEMRTGQRVAEERVRRAARTAALLVVVGSDAVVPDDEVRGTRWWWRQDSDGAGGEWYLVPSVPPSPMTEGLARVPWDSLPPLRALVLSDGGEGDTVLTAQLSRRGVPYPVLVASSRGGRRSLETRAAGFHRWGLRGGAGVEALRTVVAVGVDWLLRSNRAGAVVPVTATPSVTRGHPVSFRWHGSERRDSLRVTLSSDGAVSDTVLRFGPDGVARLALPTGVYRWDAAEVAVRGTLVVEAYSDEFPPAAVWVPPPVAASEADAGPLGYARDRWWVFLLVVAVLATEWAWRQRRGLP
jgi:hypothetical protein